MPAIRLSFSPLLERPDIAVLREQIFMRYVSDDISYLAKG